MQPGIFIKCAPSLFKSYLAIVLITLSAVCVGQNNTTDSSTTVVAYWQKGDVANFRLTQVKEQYENKKLLMSGSSVSDIEIKVLFANVNSYILNWRYRDIKVEGNETLDETEKEFASLIKGVNFIYQVSKLGEFQELVNWAEVQAAVIKIIDRLTGKSKNTELLPALQQARNIFSNKENIERMIMKDVQLFHAIYGGEYPLNQKMGADTQLPNTIGGNPFPATVELELYELNPKENTCKIRVVQTVDKQKAVEEIAAWQKANGQAKSKISVDISDKTEYEIELARGWVTKYSNIRSSEINGRKSVERQELKRVN